MAKFLQVLRILKIEIKIKGDIVSIKKKLGLREVPFAISLDAKTLLSNSNKSRCVPNRSFVIFILALEMVLGFDIIKYAVLF